MAQQIEGDTNESYYLCEGIWFDKNQNKLVDKRDNNKELDITKIDDKILIFEREVDEWIFHPIKIMFEDDQKNRDTGKPQDEENDKNNYKPFKNAIFILIGCFAFIEKIERYKTGNPKQQKIQDSTDMLMNGLKKIFSNLQNLKDLELKNILSSTRHALMHSLNLGDCVLVNYNYNNAINPIISQQILNKLEINPTKMLEMILNDYNVYVVEIKKNNQPDTDNFKKVFDVIYKDEIAQLTQGAKI